MTKKNEVCQNCGIIAPGHKIRVNNLKEMLCLLCNKPVIPITKPPTMDFKEYFNSLSIKEQEAAKTEFKKMLSKGNKCQICKTPKDKEEHGVFGACPLTANINCDIIQEEI